MGLEVADKLAAERYLQNGVKELGLEQHKIGNLRQFPNQQNLYFYSVNGEDFKKNGRVVAFTMTQLAGYAQKQKALEFNAQVKSENIQGRARSGQENLEPYKADDAGYIDKSTMSRAKKERSQANDAPATNAVTQQWVRKNPSNR